MSTPVRQGLFPTGVVVCGLIALGGAGALGQGRKAVRLTQPREPARLFAVRLESYSFGLGTLESAAPSSDGGILRSTIAEGRSFWIPRLHSALGRPDSPAPLPPRAATPGSRRLPRPRPAIPISWYPLPLMPRRVRPPFGVPTRFRATGVTVLDVTYDYLEAVGLLAPDVLRDRGGYVTTLVPDRPGVYRLYMARGEQAFRAGNFAGAFDEFRIAHDISAPSIESLLSLAHTRFAAGPGSYAAASFYLQRALRRLPELPLTPLKPIALFGSEQMYRMCLDRLAKHLRQYPDDVDAMLLSAYFSWFEGRHVAARSALSRAESARRTQLAGRDSQGDSALETIRIFRRGITASGVAPSTSRPGVEARPATRPAASRKPPSPPMRPASP